MNRKLRFYSLIALGVLLFVNVLLAIFSSPASEEKPTDVYVPPEAQEVLLEDITAGLPESRFHLVEQHAASPSDVSEYTEEELAAITKFYSETVFVGDSLLIGYRSYVMARDKYGCFGNSLMLASAGYSTSNANKLISDTSIHPYYQSFQHYVWDSAKMFGAKRMILCFWANEFSRGELEHSKKNLERLVSRVVEVNPDIEIYIISPCHRYISNFVGEEKLTNQNLTLLAEMQHQFCNEHGGGYIEISKHMGNEIDGMYKEYTKDKYVHVNNTAYAIWYQIFMDYALGRETPVADRAA